MSDQFQEMPVSNFDGTFDPHQNGSNSAFYNDAYARPTDDFYSRPSDAFHFGDQCGRPSIVIINPQRPDEFPQINDGGYGYERIGFEEPQFRHQQFQHPAPWDEIGYSDQRDQMSFPDQREQMPREMLASELPFWIEENTVDRLANDDFIFDIAGEASGSVSYRDLVITLGLATMRLNDEPGIDNKTLFDDVLKMAPMLGVSDQGVAELQRIVAEKLARESAVEGEVIPADQQTVIPQDLVVPGASEGQTVEPQEMVVPQTSADQQTVVPQDMVIPGTPEGQTVAPQDTVTPQTSGEQTVVPQGTVVPQTSDQQTVVPQQSAIPQQSLDPSAFNQTDAQSVTPPGQVASPEVDTVFGEPADPTQVASGDQGVVPNANNQTAVPNADGQSVVPGTGSADAFAQQLDPSQVPQQFQGSQLPTELGQVDAGQGNVPTDMSQQQASTNQQQADASQQRTQGSQSAPAGGTVMDQLMG